MPPFYAVSTQRLDSINGSNIILHFLLLDATLSTIMAAE